MMHRRRTLLVAATAGQILLMLSGAGCGCHPSPAAPPEGRDIALIVTQVPAGSSAPALPARLLPEARYPEGSRVVLVDHYDESYEPRVLSRGFASAGSPALSPSANSVLFAARRSEQSGWGVFEVGIRGSRPRVVVEGERDCIDPAYLTENLIVLACADDPGARADGKAVSWSLYTVSGRDRDLERITFGPGSAHDPTALADGRILFSMWQEAGIGRPTRADGLFTINPDGTLLESFAGSHTRPARKFRARPTGDGEILFMTARPDGTDVRIATVSMARPHGKIDHLALGLIPGSVEPLPDAQLLVTGLHEPPATGSRVPGATRGVYRARKMDGLMEPVFNTPDWDEVEAIPVIPRKPAIGRPSAVDPAATHGQLLCYDAAFSDGKFGPPAESPRPALVSITDRDDIILGEFAVEDDGSFNVELPADTPVRVRTFDPAGLEISRSGWFWVRPGEVRACFGCHENRDTAPANRFVKAVQLPPVKLRAPLEITAQ